MNFVSILVLLPQCAATQFQNASSTLRLGLASFHKVFPYKAKTEPFLSLAR